MSDSNNGNNAFLIAPFGVFIYGSGVGVLTVYPRATGEYRAYLGSNLQPVKITQGVADAITDGGMTLERVPIRAPELPPTSKYYTSHWAHRAGNNATVHAANTVRAQYGWRASNIQMGLHGPGLSQNLWTIPNTSEVVQVDLSFRKWSA